MPKDASKASRVELPSGWTWRFNHGSKRWAQCLDVGGSVLGAVSTSLNTRTREWSTPLITLSRQNFTLESADVLLGVAKEACAIARALVFEVTEPNWECRGCGSTAWEITDDQQKWCADCARPANWQQHADAVAKEEDDGA